MPYGRKYTPRKYTPRTTPRKSPRTPRGKYTPRKNYSKKAPMATFAKRVQSIISRNIENKYTSTATYRADVSTLTRTCTVVSPVAYTDALANYVWAPGNGVTGMFAISQGTNIQQRIGNKIKLKRWVIKGLIQPNPTFDDVPPLVGFPGICTNSFCGYVDLYFGRRMDNQQPVGNDLNKFYQNGSLDITPQGKAEENLYRMNKDLYKVYWHRKFKMGTGVGFTGSGPSLNYDAQPTVPGANGYTLTKSFGFDITKYVLKNKVICYDESEVVPQNADMDNLSLWAIYHPAAGDFAGVSNFSGVGQTSVNKSFYQISALSYAEYEDA